MKGLPYNKIYHRYPVKKKNNFPLKTKTGGHPIKARIMISEGTRILVNKIKSALNPAKMRSNPKRN